MPWYWSDDLARFLVQNDSIDADRAAELKSSPVAIRREERTVEEAARAIDEDDELLRAA